MTGALSQKMIIPQSEITGETLDQWNFLPQSKIVSTQVGRRIHVWQHWKLSLHISILPTQIPFQITAQTNYIPNDNQNPIPEL